MLHTAAIQRLPKHWRPAAYYHYYRARSLLEPELAFACRHLTAGMRAIDIGANEGVYTHAFASTGAMVEAFEPQSSCLEILRAYSRRRSTVSVHGVALGDKETVATLSVPRLGGMPISGWARLGASDRDALRYEVEVRTLDSFNFTNVGVVKIDVEGFELLVLRGARETLVRWRPLILVEIEQRHLDRLIQEAFQEVCDLGYNGSFLLPDRGMTPLEEFEVSVHQDLERADTPHQLYINNFIFTPTVGNGS